MIVEELNRQGLAVAWDGTFSERIFIPDIDWKRRPAPKATMAPNLSAKPWWKLW